MRSNVHHRTGGLGGRARRASEVARALGWPVDRWATTSWVCLLVLEALFVIFVAVYFGGTPGGG